MRCHNCGSNKVESEASSGTSFCVDCGTVLEENTIVSEVTFGETAGGKAILQGAFVGESGRINSGGMFGRGRGREGQEQAIENGRVKIANLAHAVRLPERYREAAGRYYNLAVVNRFTRGRRSDHVAAVCLYAVCRTEKSSHMLIDFSDILQVNVFTLGATFLKLCRVLNLSLPHVDPSLYISRFAVALDFGDYTQRVAQDAVRIAQRMDRDWITSGRRPAGICGACLLIAARMNGFRRTTREMIYIVKVAEVTIQKRLQEFNQTESAQLSVRDFRTIWLENRADPPSFKKSRKINLDEEDELDEDDENANSELATLVREAAEEEDEDDEMMGDTLRNPDEEMELDALAKAEDQDETDDVLIAMAKSTAAQEEKTKEKVEMLKLAKEKVLKEQEEMLNPDLDGDTQAIANEMESWLEDENIMKAADEIEKEKHDESSKKAEEKKEGSVEEEDEDEIMDDANLSDVDCPEIEAMILTPDEVALKTRVWYTENKDYLEEMAVRRMIEKDKAPTHNKRGKKQKKKLPPAKSPAEAAKQLMEKKKLSKKINQAVFDDMFESPESIAKIKARDAIQRITGTPVPEEVEYEVVEESGDVASAQKKKETKGEGSDDDDDDDEIDPDDMADDERFLMEQRQAFYNNDDDVEDYVDDDDDGY